MCNLRERITQGNNTRFPSLPSGTPHLFKTVMNDNLSLNELVSLLESYPVITARLISLANSAWLASEREIVELKTACVRLGLNVVQTLVLTLCMRTPFKVIRSHYFDTTRFWASSLIMATVARKLCVYFQIKPQLAGTVGLIHHLGLLWLVNEAPDDVDAVLLSIVDKPDASFNQLLISRCGIGYIEATTCLLRLWEMPETIIVAVDPQTDQGESLVRMRRLSWLCTKGLYGGYDFASVHFPELTEIGSETLSSIYEALLTETEKTKALALAVNQHP